MIDSVAVRRANIVDQMNRIIADVQRSQQESRPLDRYEVQEAMEDMARAISFLLQEVV